MNVINKQYMEDGYEISLDSKNKRYFFRVWRSFGWGALFSGLGVLLLIAQKGFSMWYLMVLFFLLGFFYVQSLIVNKKMLYRIIFNEEHVIVDVLKYSKVADSFMINRKHLRITISDSFGSRRISKKIDFYDGIKGVYSQKATGYWDLKKFEAICAKAAQ